ncbi:PKD domain-containing protein [Seonamhaeicola maritimus]|uniref:PKD domain-containing protein n=1 Tax=Seonamhaeicola maritimus TaxID=2591822 RepID=UPI002494BA62|nr:PKD domain-containing protein [Seonamhaeicola maritimus]
MSQNTLNYQTARNGKVFKIFQFPRDQMPHIDGKPDDWDMIPDSYVYGTGLLKDTADGHGSDIDSSDLDVKVKVGWVKGLNRLYFSYEATDDFWDFGRFSNKGYQNDIFEVVVDGDLSGGPFISTPVFKKKELKLHSNTDAYFESHFNFSGVHAQNYHIFTPPINNAWVMIWGHQHWIGEFPYSHYAYDYNFSHGESGKLFLEFWITPYDHASLEGPQQAIESQLEQDKIIGLSWSILDFDGEKRDGHINLSHTTGMVNNASSLCAFKLMPIERDLTKFIQAEWSFKIIDMENRLVSFKDESEGHIVKREWDFGDGNYSNEQNPIYQFKEVGVNKVITLTVEGPAGKSKRTRYSEVMIR